MRIPIEKGLDRLLILKYFLNEVVRLSWWVSSCGDLDHNPMLLEVLLVQEKPPRPFITKSWMVKEW